MPAHPGVLTDVELAAVLRVTPWQVRVQARQGTLPVPPIVVGARRRYSVTAVANLLGMSEDAVLVAAGVEAPTAS